MTAIPPNSALEPIAATALYLQAAPSSLRFSVRLSARVRRQRLNKIP